MSNHVIDIDQIVIRLNTALAKDWKAISALIGTRVPVSTDMQEDTQFTLIPLNKHQMGLGLLGLINGLIANTAEPVRIEANVQNGEIVSFTRSDRHHDVVDVRTVNTAAMLLHRCYRVTDRAGNHWIGNFLGFRGSDHQEGVYLQLADGAIARVFFHDVAKVVTY